MKNLTDNKAIKYSNPITTTDVKSTAFANLKEIRNKYLESLRFSQELMLEWMIADSDYYEMLRNNTQIGYFIKSKENILVEFYLRDEYIPEKEEIFKQITEQYHIEKVYCKSFDSVLLTCCHTWCKSSKIAGTLFRDYTNEINLKENQNISIRLADGKDRNFLQSFDSGLYETPEELEFMISNKMLYMFEQQKQLIGCGFLIRILPDKFYYDIGMWTNPLFRNQGFATYIIAYLKKYCLEHSYIPVCGCAFENIASRKTLERNGFISKHCLIEFTIPNPAILVPVNRDNLE